MRRACALLALVALMLSACGKYGPPVRTRPAPKAEAAAEAEAAETDDEELERSQ
jgi:predicted small lipoprotein YifL